MLNPAKAGDSRKHPLWEWGRNVAFSPIIRRENRDLSCSGIEHESAAADSPLGCIAPVFVEIAESHSRISVSIGHYNANHAKCKEIICPETPLPQFLSPFTKISNSILVKKPSPCYKAVPVQPARRPAPTSRNRSASSTRTEISLFIKPPNFFMLIGFNQKADKWEFVHLLSS